MEPCSETTMVILPNAPAAPGAEATPENIIVSRSPAAKPNLLTLPAEIRELIWGFCTALKPGQEPVVVAHKLLIYNTDEQGEWKYPPRRFDTLIPLVNKQMYGEAFNLFCRTHRFTLVLNAGSCIGPVPRWPYTALKDHPRNAAVPSLWSFAFRHTVREMRKFRIFLVVKLQHGDEGRLTTYGEWQEKNERSLVISTAAENLCEILALSETLTSVEIVYVNQGRPELTTGRESCILTSFGQLRRIKHVKVDGVSKAWTQHLTTTMKMDK